MNRINVAIDRLKNGHQKFLDGEPIPAPSVECLRNLAENGQHPFAIVISCSDSRVIPELIFHAQIGDIFVIRTAGQVVSEIEMGSSQYAVEHLGTRLIVVLGHTHCGAVQGACESHHSCGKCLATLLSIFEPSVKTAKTLCCNDNDIVACAEDLNIKAAMETIANNTILKEIEGLHIVGAKYDIASGRIVYWKTL